MGRRVFGSVRRLPSGRYQASYWHDGVRQVAATTFLTKSDANLWLSGIERQLFTGDWVDPRAGRIAFAEYADRWLVERSGLRPRTVELYETLFRLYLKPAFGRYDLAEISPQAVRRWFASLAAGRRTMAAKCYRLLRTVMSTAVEDGLIGRNPCILKNAGRERPAERPIANLPQVFALADAADPRCRAMFLVATFCSLRFGELIALTRRRVDLLHGLVHVVEQYVELVDGTRVLGPPKTAAGQRTVAIPRQIVAELDDHLARYGGPGPDGLVFPSPEGEPWRRSNFNRRVFRPAVDAANRAGAGLPAAFRFHDLRHTGNTLAAATGASLKELMARMGHASSAAAIVYQHATAERELAIAEALGDLIDRARQAPAGSDRRAGPGDSPEGGAASVRPSPFPPTRTSAHGSRTAPRQHPPGHPPGTRNSPLPATIRVILASHNAIPAVVGPRRPFSAQDLRSKA